MVATNDGLHNLTNSFMKPFIAPSILSADFGHLNDDIASVESESDIIHVDVMDGHFVSNLTIGAPVVRCLRSKKPLECHLMIERPDIYLDDFVKAGARRISVHREAPVDLHAVVMHMKKAGIAAGVAINPSTPLSSIYSVLDDLDFVLCMTVFPGFGGQKFHAEVLPKIAELRKKKPKIDIEVDGGINTETIAECWKAGANIFVAGSFIFKAEDRLGTIRKLRAACK